MYFFDVVFPSALIFHTCLPQCYKILQTHLYVFGISCNPSVSVFFRIPLPSQFFFLNRKPLPTSSTIPHTHFRQDSYILPFFSGVIFIRDPYPTHIGTPHPVYLVWTYPTRLAFVFSYNQLNISSSYLNI